MIQDDNIGTKKKKNFPPVQIFPSHESIFVQHACHRKKDERFKC